MEKFSCSICSGKDIYILSLSVKLLDKYEVGDGEQGYYEMKLSLYCGSCGSVIDVANTKLLKDFPKMLLGEIYNGKKA